MAIPVSLVEAELGETINRAALDKPFQPRLHGNLVGAESPEVLLWLRHAEVVHSAIVDILAV